MLGRVHGYTSYIVFRVVLEFELAVHARHFGRLWTEIDSFNCLHRLLLYDTFITATFDLCNAYFCSIHMLLLVLYCDINYYVICDFALSGEVVTIHVPVHNTTVLFVAACMF